MQKDTSSRPDDKLARLQKQKTAIDARIRQERAKLDKEKRKEDTRRKILAGAWLLNEIEKREDLKRFTMSGLNSFLTKPDDRKLFNLAPAPVAASPVSVEGNTNAGVTQ